MANPENIYWLEKWRSEYRRLHTTKAGGPDNGMLKRSALRGQLFALIREEREQHGPA